MMGGARRLRVSVVHRLTHVACLCFAADALAQDVSSGPDADRVRVRIDPTVLFDDPPAWLVGVRPGLGLDRGERFGVLGLSSAFA